MMFVTIAKRRDTGRKTVIKRMDSQLRDLVITACLSKEGEAEEEDKPEDAPEAVDILEDPAEEEDEEDDLFVP